MYLKVWCAFSSAGMHLDILNNFKKHGMDDEAVQACFREPNWSDHLVDLIPSRGLRLKFKQEFEKDKSKGDCGKSRSLHNSAENSQSSTARRLAPTLKGETSIPSFNEHEPNRMGVGSKIQLEKPLPSFCKPFEMELKEKKKEILKAEMQAEELGQSFSDALSRSWKDFCLTSAKNKWPVLETFDMWQTQPKYSHLKQALLPIKVQIQISKDVSEEIERELKLCKEIYTSSNASRKYEHEDGRPFHNGGTTHLASPLFVCNQTSATGNHQLYPYSSPVVSAYSLTSDVEYMCRQPGFLTLAKDKKELLKNLIQLQTKMSGSLELIQISLENYRKKLSSTFGQYYKPPKDPHRDKVKERFVRLTRPWKKF